MALSSKQESKQKSLAVLFRKKLDKLGCPYTEGVSESWISEMIYKPGEPRIKLLQWLFSKFDSKLHEYIEPRFDTAESKLDSRIQRLLFVASTLGFCRYDDVDLIRGVTTGSKQDAFMDKLIDLVCIKDAADDPDNKSMRNPNVVSESMPLEDQFQHDSHLMKTLVSQEKVDSMLNPRLSLLPPDLQRQYEVAMVEKGLDKDRPPKPDIQSLMESAEKLSQDLQRQQEILREVNKTFMYESPDPSRGEIVSKTMSLVLSELSQLVTGFTYCYENEMSHWCNKSPPVLNELGPAFKRVYNLLQTFVKLLKDFESIRDSYTHLSRDTKLNIKKSVTTKKASLATAGQEMLESLQECVTVLDESVHRGTANSSHSMLEVSKLAR
ncbi:HAUS augmin-like complex subunit 7 [Saccostrea echinata]|uniref:HAUS augmin-like complex subunit 7 n=1 Tax=Saccostrea echinata TaxID=191078 RepID=UPI002A840B8E|nr:HAUS augmin-like complex subunit 7 [Saccostrea echinata]